MLIRACIFQIRKISVEIRKRSIEILQALLEFVYINETLRTSYCIFEFHSKFVEFLLEFENVPSEIQNVQFVKRDFAFRFSHGKFRISYEIPRN